MNWKYLLASPCVFYLGIFLYKYYSKQQKEGGFSPSLHAKGWVLTVACFLFSIILFFMAFL